VHGALILNEARKLVIRIKRIYDAPSRNDGYRVLVVRLWPRDQQYNNAVALLHRQVKTSKFVMPDLIRHPAFSMDVAYASEDTGACALRGIRRNDGNSALLLPK